MGGFNESEERGGGLRPVLCHDEHGMESEQNDCSAEFSGADAGGPQLGIET